MKTKEQLRDEFDDLFEYEHKDKIFDWITENYVPKIEIQKLLDNGHGGGNWRRLLTNLLNN